MLFLAFAAASPFTSPARADNSLLNIAASANPTEAGVGDVISLNVSVEWDPAQATFQEIAPLASSDSLEIIKQERVEDIKLSDSLRRRSWTIQLRAWETGDVEVPAIEAPYVTADGQTAKAQSAPLNIAIHSALGATSDQAEPKPYRPPVEIQPNPKYLHRNILIGVLAAIVLALAAFVVWKLRRAPKTDAAPEGPPRPAEIVAREALNALEAEGLIERGEMKKYYTGLSEIVRQYLGSRFFISALDMTSAELMDALEGHWPNRLLAQRMEEFCSEADLVKFARWPSSGDRARVAMQTARLAIDETTPRDLAGLLASGNGARPAQAGAPAGAEERLP